MQKILLPFLIVLTLCLAVYAWLQNGKIAEQTLKIGAMEKIISARDALVAENEKAAGKLEKENQAFVEESAALREKLARETEAKQTAAATPPPAPASPEQKNPFGGVMEKMMKNPQMLDAIAARQMAVMKPMYADLVRQLKLTPEEASRFYELLGEQTTKAMQAGMKMMSGDKKAGDEMKTAQDGMKAFLGDRYAQFETYQKGIPDRAQLVQISTQMAARQTPLRPEQSNGLLQIMQQEKLNTAKFAAANTDPNNTHFTQTAVDDTYGAMEERNARILARSKNLLTAEQWTALDEQQKQTLQMQKMGMEMARDMFSKRSQ